MGKINVTISQEELHNLMSEFRRGNSWAPFQAICRSMMEAGDWNIKITPYVGDEQNLKKPKDLIEHLKRTHSSKASNKLIRNFSTRKGTK